MFDLKNLLEPWKKKIVVITAVETTDGKRYFPAWKQNRKDFLYDGDIDGNLREVLPNELVLEFDIPQWKSMNSDERKQAQEEAWTNINKLAWACKNKAEATELWITDHGGKSPHLRIILPGVETLKPQQRREYKLKVADELLLFAGCDLIFTVLDRSFTKPRALVSLEGAPHFKQKYAGSVERVIYYFKRGETE